MAKPPRVLIDLNVVIDVLKRREPFYAASADVLAAAEIGHVDGWVAAHTLTTLFYLITRDTSPTAARVHLTDLTRFLKVAPVDGRVVEQALALPYKDFEDAVQMMAGVHVGVEHVVTRDRAGFKAGPLPVLSPAELLTLLRDAG